MTGNSHHHTVHAPVHRRRGHRRASTSPAGGRSSPAARPASASRPPARSPAPAPRSRSPCATSTPASARGRRHRRRRTGNKRSASRRWTWPTAPRSPPSSPAGTARCTSWSTTPASWRCPSCSAPPRAGSCSSPPTTSATSRLATGLHPALAAAGGARVVSVSSSAHLRSPVVFDDIHFRSGPYDPWSAYGQSKTANVLFAVEATRRWADDGITVNALMPGGIRTNLQRHVSRRGPRTGCDPGGRRPRPAGRRPSRAPRPRCCSPPRRCSTASAAATSRTATRPG